MGTGGSTLIRYHRPEVYMFILPLRHSSFHFWEMLKSVCTPIPEPITCEDKPTPASPEPTEQARAQNEIEQKR
ncbi:hypothetical protein GCM10027082_47140 [Comamonas humi]